MKTNQQAKKSTPRAARKPAAPSGRVAWVRYAAGKRAMDEGEIGSVLAARAGDEVLDAIGNLIDIEMSVAVGAISAPGKSDADLRFEAGRIRAMMELSYRIDEAAGR